MLSTTANLHIQPFSLLPVNLMCPCQSHKTYQDCCQKSHIDCHNTQTAEQLMRARFSAFALASTYPFMQAFAQQYLLNSWHKETRPEDLSFEPNLVWTDLIIKGRKEGKKRHATGKVHFLARYEAPEQSSQLEEVSVFARDQSGCWVYVEGTIL